jgi:hypothetical protein
MKGVVGLVCSGMGCSRRVIGLTVAAALCAVAALTAFAWPSSAAADFSKVVKPTFVGFPKGDEVYAVEDSGSCAGFKPGLKQTITDEKRQVGVHLGVFEIKNSGKCFGKASEAKVTVYDDHSAVMNLKLASYHRLHWNWVGSNNGVTYAYTDSKGVVQRDFTCPWKNILLSTFSNIEPTITLVRTYRPF